MSEELDRDMMTVTKRGIKNRDNEIERLTADLAAANAKGDKWRLALESLTAQGSEFHNDLDRCIAYVRERYAEGHKAKGDRVKMQRDLAAANEALKIAISFEALADADGFTVIRIDRASQLDGSVKWAVRKGALCLSKKGTWEYEPSPSNRTEQFLGRTRFDSLADARAKIDEVMGGKNGE